MLSVKGALKSNPLLFKNLCLLVQELSQMVSKLFLGWRLALD